jgi:Domain of unknown function (DUF4190)
MTSPQEPDPGPAAPQPPYPYPGWAWYPPPDLGAPPAGYPPPRTTSGWAIASLVLAFFCCVPLSVIFGLIALVKMKDGRQRGRGLAIAGLGISAVWVVVAVVAGSIGVSRFNEIIQGGRFKAGDCIADVSPEMPRMTWQVVGCDQPHSGEVFAVFSQSHLDDGTTVEQDENQCRAALSTYAPSASRDPTVGWFVDGPSSVDWRSDDHTRLCVARFIPKRTGSIKAI